MTQPIYDSRQGGYRVFIGNLGSRTEPSQLKRECEKYGPLVDCWVARNPPGFAFILYKEGRDAAEAVKNMNGQVICGQRIRVEHAKARSINPRQASRRSRSRSRSRSSRHRSRSSSSSSSSSGTTSSSSSSSSSSDDEKKKERRRNHKSSEKKKHHRRKNDSEKSSWSNSKDKKSSSPER